MTCLINAAKHCVPNLNKIKIVFFLFQSVRGVWKNRGWLVFWCSYLQPENWGGGGVKKSMSYTSARKKVEAEMRTTFFVNHEINEG